MMVLSVSFSKCSAWLPYIFIFTVHPDTLISANHPTLLKYVILVFWVNYELPDHIGSFEKHFYAMFSADVLASFTQSFHIGHHYVRFILDIWLLIVVFISSVIVYIDNICPIQSPCWVLAAPEGPVEVILFLLQQLFVGTDCPGPVS